MILQFVAGEQLDCHRARRVSRHFFTRLSIGSSLSRSSDEGLLPITKLTGLRTLVLSGCSRITGLGMASFTVLTELQSPTNSFGRSRLETLASFSDLRTLNFDDGDFITDWELSSLTVLTSLRTLGRSIGMSWIQLVRFLLLDPVHHSELSMKIYRILPH